MSDCCCYNTDRTYNLGESKFIDLEVSSRQPDVVVVVTSAKYELTYLSGEQPSLEKSGDMRVDGSNLSVLISPKNTGNYDLKCTIEVSNETLIYRVRIKVI